MRGSTSPNDIALDLLLLGALAAVCLSAMVLPAMRRAQKRLKLRRVVAAQGGPIFRLRPQFRPEAPDRWTHGQARAFERVGFRPLGSFRDKGTTVHATFLHRQDKEKGTMIAQILSGIIDGRAVIVTRFDREGGVYETSAIPQSRRVPPMPPWHRTRYAGRVSAARLVREAEKWVPEAPWQTLPAERTLAYFTEGSERQARWLLVYSQLRPRHVARLAAWCGIEPDSEAMEILRRAHPTDEGT